MKMIPLRMGRRYAMTGLPGQAWDGTEGLHALRIPALELKVYSPRVDSESDMWVSLEGEMGF
jgi:hypothetical protein